MQTEMKDELIEAIILISEQLTTGTPLQECKDYLGKAGYSPEEIKQIISKSLRAIDFTESEFSLTKSIKPIGKINEIEIVENVFLIKSEFRKGKSFRECIEFLKKTGYSQQKIDSIFLRMIIDEDLNFIKKYKYGRIVIGDIKYEKGKKEKQGFMDKIGSLFRKKPRKSGIIKIR